VKLAILADIHSNSFALEAVLKAVRKRGVDTLLIAGDFVGYYFWPEEVFDLLKPFTVTAISGNHDKMLSKALNSDYYLAEVNKKYGSGLSVALNQLNNKHINWLMSLPESREFKTDNGQILVCHGSPWDNDEYVYPDADEGVLSRYLSLDVKWVIQGHTHYSMIKRLDNVTLINPGSVGQPRNRKPGAQWALLNTESHEVHFFCEQYDVKKVVEESKIRHPELPYLANILERM